MKSFKTTEKSVRLIETENTLVVEAEMNDTKAEIKKKTEEELKVKIKSVRTFIRGNRKYAYIKLNEKNPAADIAAKYGLI